MFKLLCLSIAAFALLVAVAVAQVPDLVDPMDVVPGASQGGRGDLLYLPNGTIQGVHVIQGGNLECVDPAEPVGPERCPRSGLREKSLNLDIGTGDGGKDRGDLGIMYDVGNETRIFNGHKKLRIRVHRAGVRLRGRIEVCDARGCINLMNLLRELRRRR